MKDLDKLAPRLPGNHQQVGELVGWGAKDGIRTFPFKWKG